MSPVEWVDLVHPESGGVCRVPDEPGVVAAHAGRGWVPADPAAVVSEAGPPSPDAPEWVDLVHSPSAGRASFPNNPAALEGAHALGWREPWPEPVPDPEPGPIPGKSKRGGVAPATDDTPEGVNTSA